MKHLLKLAAIILIFFSHIACRTIKNSNRQQSRNANRELVDSRIQEQESTKISLSTAITDSSGRFYQATIFPVDTFQFSLRDGFKGKALKVEVRGSVKQLIRVKEVRSISHTRDSSETTKSSRKVESEQVSVTKSTKRKNNALLYFLAAGFLIMIGFALNKFRRNSF